MAEFAYTTVPAKISGLLDKVRTAGVPPKVSVQWMKSIGYTSSNDATLINVLKQIGFVDGSNVPTDFWRKYRGDPKHVLGEAIRSGYGNLFSTYPDADRRSQSELENVFRSKSNAGEQVIGKTAQTFIKLCGLADFSGSGSSVQTHQAEEHPNDSRTSRQDAKLKANAAAHGTPSVHIDIQVHISPESSTEQIDQIFASMAKHLYGKAAV